MTDKNDFKMPFLKTTEYAAEKIYDGLLNKKTYENHWKCVENRWKSMKDQ